MTTTDPTDLDTASTSGAASNPGTEPRTQRDGERTYPYFLPGVDPRDLRASGNSRDLGDIRVSRPDLVASVIEHGVDPRISVINVAPDQDGALAVIVGFSRTAAAVAVRETERPDLTVGVLVHEPGTRRDQLVAQGVENIHRVGYTAAEEARLYQQLALEGLDTEEIARTLSRPTDQVAAGRAVAASPRTHAVADEMPELDLLTMAKLAEFDDDEDTHQGLLRVLNTYPAQLDFTIAELRSQRERQEQLVAEQTRLTGLGYTLVEDADELPDGAAQLTDLAAGDTPTPLEPADHTTCPGRAAAVYIDFRREVEIVECCLNHADHGHRPLADVMVAAAEAELAEQGVRLVDPDQPTVADLRRLHAAHAHTALTVEEHAHCPGHGAYVDTLYGFTGPDPVVRFVCDDYAAHGHVRQVSPAPSTPKRDSAYAAGERKRTRANNEAWKVAKQVRREWLAEFFTGWRSRNTTAKPAKSAGAKSTTSKSAKTATQTTGTTGASSRRSARGKQAAPLPARIQHWLASAAVLAHDHLTEAAPAHRYACTLLGLNEPAGHRSEEHPIAVQLDKKSTTESQALMIRLAQVLGAGEQHWDRAYTDNADSSWRGPTTDSRFYFRLLAELGYPLSPVEELINNPGADRDNWPHLATPTPETRGLATASPDLADEGTAKAAGDDTGEDAGMAETTNVVPEGVAEAA